LAFNYYVWYRVSQDEGAAELAVRTMMARLACRTGVTGRLLKKCDESRLWMEVYEGVVEPGFFERSLGQALDEFDVEMFLDGARRTECFLADTPIPAACAASR
jgi:hypothetical protein